MKQPRNCWIVRGIFYALNTVLPVLKRLMRRNLKNILCAFTVTLAVTPAALSQLPLFDPSVKLEDERSVTAVRTDTPPVIDGKLDDPCWAKAGTTSIFFNERTYARSTEQTIVRVTYDMENLYIAFECLESDMSSLRARERRHDRRQIMNDDSVSVSLDTFHDHRGCYVFMTNPAGARFESRKGLGSWRSGEIGWDCEWKVAASRDEDRWFAEMSIPLDELLFVRKDDQTWGINFRRDEQRLQEEGFWSFRRDDTEHARSFGELRGLDLREAVLKRRPVFSPYVSGTYEFGDEHDSEVSVGGDMWYKLNTNVTSAITINPDFGQVETDADDIVLRDVERFLPERRPYFKEGMELFETPLKTLFHSRRIFDIDYGAKISGKSGPYSFALLDADGEIVRDEQQISGNYLAARALRDLGKESTIGVLATNSEREDGYNRLAAVDTFLRLPHDLDFSSQYAISSREDDVDESDDWTDDAFQLSVTRGERPFWVTLSYVDIGEDFEPDLSFISRKDIKGPALSMNYRRDLQSTRYHDVYGYFRTALYENHDGKTILRDYSFRSGFRLNNGFQFGVGGKKDFHDPYDNYNVGVQLGLNSLDWSRSTELTLTTGEFEEVPYNSAGLRQGFVPTENLTVSLDGELRREEPDDADDENVWLTRMVCNYALTEDAWLKASIQFSHEDQRNFNIIFKWGFLEDVDWYVVYNEVKSDDDPLSRMLFSKVVYTF